MTAMTTDELVALLRAGHDDALADYSEAQHALADADARRRAFEAALVALEPLLDDGPKVDAPLPVVDLLAAKTATAEATVAAKPAISSLRDKYGVRVNADRLAQVAALAATAAASGASPRNYVAQQLDVSPVYAGQLLTAARRAGHDIPYERQPKAAKSPVGEGTATRPAVPTPTGPRNADDLPGPDQRPDTTWTPKPGELVVQCDDCGHTEPITRCSALNRHCLAQHRRAATIDERSPRPWQDDT